MAVIRGSQTMIWRARSNHTRPGGTRSGSDGPSRLDPPYPITGITTTPGELWGIKFSDAKILPEIWSLSIFYLGGKFQRLSVRLFHSSHMPYLPHNIRRKLCPLCPVDPMLADETNVRQWNTDVGQITCNKNICWLKTRGLATEFYCDYVWCLNYPLVN